MSQPQIVVIGTMDTKADELLFAKNEIGRHNCSACIMDLSVGSKPAVSGNITSEQLVVESGHDIERVWGNPDRPTINRIVTEGAIARLNRMYAAGAVGGVLGIGGAGGSLMVTDVMRSLPFGVPKFMVSSNAAAPGFSSRYFGTKDITMMHTVADIAGINDMLATLLRQAAAATCAMARAATETRPTMMGRDRPSVALCELMLSAENVRFIKTKLEERGFQVTVFMATGVGDTAMEEAIDQGLFDAVVDLSPGGIIDSIVGGTRAACPQRLETAGRKGIPQIVTPGGLEFIAPPRSKYSDDYAQRKAFEPDKLRRLLRSSHAELRAAARLIADKLNRSLGPVTLVIPLHGWSRIDGPGKPLYDPDAVKVFLNEIRTNLLSTVKVVEFDGWIEEKSFGRRIADIAANMLATQCEPDRIAESSR
jgi:uncharacterized protein (UPF0261 family)